MKIIKSQFEPLVQYDMNQFRKIAETFQNVEITDKDTLFQLQKDTWLLGTRWSEIQSNASKIAEQYGLRKMDFSDYCYQKYRQLQELHITTRSWFRQAWEDERALRMSKDIL